MSTRKHLKMSVFTFVNFREVESESVTRKVVRTRLGIASDRYLTSICIFTIATLLWSGACIRMARVNNYRDESKFYDAIFTSRAEKLDGKEGINPTSAKKRPLSLSDVKYLTFLSEKYQVKFRNFKSLHYDPNGAICVVILITIVISFQFAFNTQNNIPYRIVFATFPLVSGYATIIMKYLFFKYPRYHYRWTLFPEICASIFIISFQLYYGIYIVSTSVKLRDSGAIFLSDSDSALLPVFFLLFCQKVMPPPRSWVIFLSWIIVVAFTVGKVATSSMESILTIVIVISFLFILYKSEEQYVLNFIASYNLNDIEVSHAKEMTKFNITNKQYSELKQLISSVAHDLKTPLQAFQMNLGCLEELLKDSTTSSQEPIEVLGKDNVDITSNAAKETSGFLLSLRATCSFMEMIINRSIDYTKCSNGLPLTPTVESVNLQHMLNWPILCVQHMQTRVPVELAPLPASVTGNIMTDRLWLQDNLLCIISNAVKYSTFGVVKIVCKQVMEDGSHASTHGARLLHRTMSRAKMLTRTLSNRRLFGGSRTTPDISTTTLAAVLPNEDSSTLSKRSLGNGPVPVTKQIRFEVSNYGIELAQEEVDRLFVPFGRAEVGGSGLGLFSLSKRVEALGGSYGAHRISDGSENPGVCVWFSVPLQFEKERGSSLDSSSVHGVSHSSISAGAAISRNSMSPASSVFVRPGDGSPKPGVLQRQLSGGIPSRPSILKRQNSGGIQTRQETLWATSNRGAQHYKHHTGLSDMDTVAMFDVKEMNSFDGHDCPDGDNADEYKSSLDKFGDPSSLRDENTGTRNSRMHAMEVSTIDEDLPMDVSIKFSLPSPRLHRIRKFSNKFEHTAESQGKDTSPSVTRVLVVDDSMIILKATSKMLERSKYVVDTAENGLRALKMMELQAYHIVLLDLQMPVMDGLETIKRIRASERDPLDDKLPTAESAESYALKHVYPGTPLVVIGMSANSDRRTQDQALDAGMNHFVSKPFTSEKLTETLVKYLPTGQTSFFAAAPTNVSSIPKSRPQSAKAPFLR